MSLTITRRIGEAIYIEGDVEIYVVDIKGKAVRLRIHAPNKNIYRKEVLLKIAKESIEKGYKE